MHDPRATHKLSARDMAVLVFVAIAREVAQYQIHALFFAGKSEVVVSRCVRRLLGLGLIAVDRWRKVGINRLRLTPAGAGYLLEHRLSAEQQIHVATRPAADKDIAHSLWIVDLLVLFRLFTPAVEALPCWHLRRKLGAAAGMSVPDVLALSPAPKAPLIAVEVDRATERMAVVLQKLRALDETLATLASDADAAVVFLTIGERRVQAVRKAVAEARFRASIVVEPLPWEPGRPGLRMLAQTVFKRDV
jgi:hypothetical protein